MKFKLFLFISLFLSSCASAPSSEELANADYGRLITTSECKSIAEARIRSTLKDPSSAIFTSNGCTSGYWHSVPVMGLPIAYGYLQSGTVNAKNSFGGYVGARSYSVLIRNGIVVRYCIVDDDGLCFPSS
tara:strand:+ start:467 stop:856 length:390 start_codon:yes stop_codon:yes gene_type:complete